MMFWPRLIGIALLPVMLVTSLLIGAGMLAGTVNPSARQLLYVSVPDLEGHSTIYLGDLRTGMKLGVYEYLGWGSMASWSPDGRRIAFSGFQESVVRRDIFLLDLRSGTVEQITGESLLDHNAPSWSPDGRYLVYQGLDADNQWALYLHDLSVDDVNLLHAHAAITGYPTWSPDGGMIAFTTAQDLPSGVSDLYVLHVESGEVRKMTNALGLVIAPDWSPDGERLMFALGQGGSSLNLYTISTNGDDLRRLRANSANHSYASWSPDGEQIAVISDWRDGRYRRVYIMNANGRGMRLFTEPEAGYRIVRWRPAQR